MLYTDDQKRDNLRKLADYLLGLPLDYVGFDMKDFFDTYELKAQIRFDTSVAFDNEIREKMREVTTNYAKNNGGVARCGAVACAVGHGPTIGLYAVDDDFGDFTKAMDWFRYTRRVFINSNGDNFEWMFGGGWYKHDNTPHGAGRRILYYLEHGVPRGFNNSEEEGGYDQSPNMVAVYNS